MRSFDFRFAAVGLLSSDFLHLLVTEECGLFAEFAAACGGAGLLASLALAIFAGGVAVSLALTLAFAETIALLLEKIGQLLAIPLLAGFASQLGASFAKLLDVGI